MLLYASRLALSANGYGGVGPWGGLRHTVTGGLWHTPRGTRYGTLSDAPARPLQVRWCALRGVRLEIRRVVAGAVLCRLGSELGWNSVEASDGKSAC
jgi:hypothetical protein